MLLEVSCNQSQIRINVKEDPEIMIISFSQSTVTIDKELRSFWKRRKDGLIVKLLSRVLPTRYLAFPSFKEVWIWNLNQVSKLVSGPWFSAVLVKYSFLSFIPKFFGLWRSKRNLVVFLSIQEMPCLTIRYQRQAITDVSCPHFTLG